MGERIDLALEYLYVANLTVDQIWNNDCSMLADLRRF